MNDRQPPILFFAFANNESGRYLDYLKRESTAVHQALLPVDAKGFVKVVREESAEVDDLFRLFTAYRGRIAVFHYAGHADGRQLDLEDQSAGMQPLSRLIAEQKDTLRLVFLNGCGTAGQVAYLHRLGIPVVIATHCPVEDNKAQAFADRFYSALANHYSLEAAFLHAKAHLEIKYGESAQLYREASFTGSPPLDKLPWGLYLVPGADPAILAWKLPRYFAAPPPASMQVSYAVNKNIGRLLAAIKRRVPHLREENYPTEEALIITSFPWIISVHLFRLFADAESMSVAGLPRLRELIQAYVSTTRFLSFIALAQLWDEIKSGRYLLGDQLKEFFLLQESVQETYDYMLLLHATCARIAAAEMDWFLPEIREVSERYDANGSSFDQYRYVESLRQRLHTGDMPAAEVEEGCYLCESILTDLLTMVAGLANFSLLTVRDIRVINPANIAVATPFEHMIGDLHVPFQAYLKHRPRSLEEYINSHSVLLTQRTGETRISKYLNLSPLYMDKTAFGDAKGRNTPMIFTLQHWAAGKFVFQNLSYNVNQAGRQSSPNSIDTLTVHRDMEEYQIISEQMNALIQDIGG